MRLFRRSGGCSSVALAVFVAGCGGGGSAAPQPARDGSVEGLDGSSEAMTSGMDAGPGANDGASADGAVIAPQQVGPHIVVDQFGYRTSAEKIAVIRNPKTGFDSDASFGLGGKYALVDSASGQTVLEGTATFWGGDAGAVDPSSGDQSGRFDFSTVTTPGSYYVLEEMSSVRSSAFKIADSVYQDALVQAARVFYYQRDAAKPAAYAGAGWADTAEHPQNAQCKLYTAVDAGAATRDLHGGWFDAGDQSKYTIFMANNAIELLRAYSETPSAFTDGTNVPESGNGVPDVLDEVKWALDWLSLMQNPDGSVLSIVNNAGASPPSADSAPCTYGPASTSATMAASAAFAYASRVLGASGAATTAYPGYAAGLATRATNAWSWASANPAVTFDNTAAGLGGREEEVDANGQLYQALQAAVFLFEMNGGAAYQAFFDANYTQLPTTLDPFAMGPLDTALEYTRSAGATPAVATAIISSFQSRLAAFPNFAAQHANADPYLAPLQTYPWGSNGAKAGQGNMFFDVDEYAPADAGTPSIGSLYAERYIHYLHGVNPLGLVYLSNMGAHGATNSVSRIFSLWFTPSSQWAAAGASAYGPPPGFLSAGPNPTYSWDVCCPTGCGSPENDALCGAAPLAPPAGQPIQKSYRDFNSSWPLDSWLVSESNDGYEVQYIRLLSKFVH
jgi:endoglucanase